MFWIQKKSYVYFIFSVLWIVNYAQDIVTPCTTLKNESGLCLPLTNCLNNFRLTNNKKAQTYFKKTRCGSKNDNKNNPKVCCDTHNPFEKEIFPKNCGLQNDPQVGTLDDRILGGKKAKLDEFPWMARLLQKKNKKYVFNCTGFLVTSKFIITAAHCLDSKIDKIQLGEHNTKTKIDCNLKHVCAPKPQVIKVKRKIVHPSYNRNFQQYHHDIALIELKKSVKFSKYVSPICLSETSDFQPPARFWSSGWGATDADNLSIMSTVKLKVPIMLYSHSKCVKKYKNLNLTIIDQQICAGGTSGRDSCTGDSGGPLMFEKENRWFAGGIVSFGKDCGNAEWPGVYTNIASYENWISENIIKYQSKAKKKNYKH